MKDSDQIVLGPTIKRLLEEKGLTMLAVSKMARVPKATLSGWMHNAKPKGISVAQVRRVARVFGVTLEYALFGEEDTDLARTLNGAARKIVLDGFYRIQLEKLEPTKGK